jgi:hypothetical protein
VPAAAVAHDQGAAITEMVDQMYGPIPTTHRGADVMSAQLTGIQLGRWAGRWLPAYQGGHNGRHRWYPAWVGHRPFDSNATA